jgi:DNA-3-methyladenine glycosylase
MYRNPETKRGDNSLNRSAGESGIPLGKMRKLPRSFYIRPALTVARDLLGTYFVRRRGAQVLLGRIVEVEAYMGSLDPASHAYRGMTKRNEVMFGQAGHLYVYFTYGKHFCANVVTEREGIGQAVLLRAVQPLKGIHTMRRNRHLPKGAAATELCSGPAKLCQAFAVGRKENGIDLCGNRIWLARDARAEPRPAIQTTTRIGISVGKRNKWRFLFNGNPFVSQGRPVSG